MQLLLFQLSEAVVLDIMMEKVFENHLILSEIMKFLPISDLHNCQLVSKQWQSASRKNFLKSLTICFKEPVTTSIQKYLNEYKDSDHKNFRFPPNFNVASIVPEESQVLEQFFNETGANISRMECNTLWEGNDNVQRFEEFLSQLPNLTEVRVEIMFYTKFPFKFTQQIVIPTVRRLRLHMSACLEDFILAPLVDKLLRTFPNCEYWEFHSLPRGSLGHSILTEMAQNPKRFKKPKGFRIASIYCVETFQLLEQLQPLFPLRSLEVCHFDWKPDLGDALNSLLIHLAPSLESLTLQMHIGVILKSQPQAPEGYRPMLQSEYRHTLAARLHQNIPIMPQLKKLSLKFSSDIRIKRPEVTLFGSTLVYPIQFPLLQELLVKIKWQCSSEQLAQVLVDTFVPPVADKTIDGVNNAVVPENAIQEADEKLQLPISLPAISVKRLELSVCSQCDISELKQRVKILFPEVSEPKLQTRPGDCHRHFCRYDDILPCTGHSGDES